MYIVHITRQLCYDCLRIVSCFSFIATFHKFFNVFVIIVTELNYIKKKNYKQTPFVRLVSFFHTHTHTHYTLESQRNNNIVNNLLKVFTFIR